MTRTGPRSMSLAAHMQTVIPWGNSTCSKRPALMPEEPGVIVRGEGCRVWDLDGREFIDFRNSLGPVVLGYRHPKVDQAIRAQLDSGIAFGHPHPMEGQLADELIQMLPGIERVRFLKTGGEAIAACIRIARASTGRDHIIQVGYNGWLNSLAADASTLPSVVSATVPPGVPRAVSALHHAATWGDLSSIEQVLDNHPGDVAAVVVAAGYPDMDLGHEFLPAVRTLTARHGTLLILDEVVTGLRIAIGGAGEYFGVQPDLAVFGKALGNGMPIAAYVGRADVMSALDVAIVSSTLGGETLSLAAALAVLRTFREDNVVEHLWSAGERFWTAADEVFRAHDLPIRTRGLWPCRAFEFGTEQPSSLREQFMRAAYANGLSLYDVSYVNLSHSADDIEEALGRLDLACSEVVLM